MIPYSTPFLVETLLKKVGQKHTGSRAVANYVWRLDDTF